MRATGADLICAKEGEPQRAATWVSRLTCSFKLPKKNHQPLPAKITMVFVRFHKARPGVLAMRPRVNCEGLQTDDLEVHEAVGETLGAGLYGTVWKEENRGQGNTCSWSPARQ